MRLRLVAPSAVVAVFLALSNMGHLINGLMSSSETAAQTETALQQKTASIRKIISDPSADLESGSDARAQTMAFSQAASEVLPNGLAIQTTFEKTFTVRRGDTLMALMVRANVDRSDAHQAIAALQTHFDPRRLRAGQELTVRFEETKEDTEFTGLVFEPDFKRSIVVQKDTSAGFSAEQKERTFETRLVAAASDIRSNMFEAGADVGVPTSVMSNLIRVFSWEVDFQRDIRAGDRFEILYETAVSEDDSVVRSGVISYAMLRAGGKEHRIYRFKDSGGHTDYFNEDGSSVRKALLKTPVDGYRISSRFGMRRHPILGYSKMHKGVDFAAPRGTPIYAAGDGIVKKAGWLGSYGKYVRIKHNSKISTAYAHMTRIAKGLRPGDRVRQRQLIGYVGTTGRSTGPHLHYEVLINGKHVNPLGVDLPTEHVLTTADMRTFKRMVNERKEQWAMLSTPETTRVADASAKTGACVGSSCRD